MDAAEITEPTAEALIGAALTGETLLTWMLWADTSAINEVGDS
jgi:hypothetical protein